VSDATASSTITIKRPGTLVSLGLTVKNDKTRKNHKTPSVYPAVQGFQVIEKKDGKS